VKETKGTEIFNSIGVRFTVTASPARRSRESRSTFRSIFTSQHRPSRQGDRRCRYPPFTQRTLRRGLPKKQLFIGDDAFRARYFQKRIDEIHGLIQATISSSVASISPQSVSHQHHALLPFSGNLTMMITLQNPNTDPFPRMRSRKLGLVPGHLGQAQGSGESLHLHLHVARELAAVLP
jgi:hypothetical protein